MKRRAKAVPQLQIQVDWIARRPTEAVEWIVAMNGEIIEAVARYLAMSDFEHPCGDEAATEPFGRWLISQVAARRGDTIGELAKMAKADPGFPKQGDAEAARRRLGMAGADPDTFEALDDAEREYDRL